jgi:hypothetical protein
VIYDLHHCGVVVNRQNLMCRQRFLKLALRVPTLQFLRKGEVSLLADSGGWRSAFRSDVDHDSEVMPISIPN